MPFEGVTPLSVRCAHWTKHFVLIAIISLVSACGGGSSGPDTPEESLSEQLSSQQPETGTQPETDKKAVILAGLMRITFCICWTAKKM